MNTMFDFLWIKWDKKLSELEGRTDYAQGEETALPVSRSAGLQGNDTEAKYLSDIIRQNVNEIKGLNLKLARQVVDIEHLKRELEAAGEKKAKRDRFLRNGRMRVLFALKKLRIKLKEFRQESLEAKRLYRSEAQKCAILKDENEFLKTEVNSYMGQMKHYIEHIKTLEGTVTAKEDQLSKLYVNLKASEATNEKLFRELDKSNLEKRMMQIHHEVRKAEAAHHHTRRGGLRKWLSTPLVDVKI